MNDTPLQLKECGTIGAHGAHALQHVITQEHGAG